MFASADGQGVSVKPQFGAGAGAGADGDGEGDDGTYTVRAEHLVAYLIQQLRNTVETHLEVGISACMRANWEVFLFACVLSGHLGHTGPVLCCLHAAREVMDDKSLVERRMAST